MFAKLPLVTPFISNLTRLTAVVCMKVRFEAKVTRGFSLSPRRLCDSLSPLRGLLLISFVKKNQEKPLGPGYNSVNQLKLSISNAFVLCASILGLLLWEAEERHPLQITCQIFIASRFS